MRRKREGDKRNSQRDSRRIRLDSENIELPAASEVRNTGGMAKDGKYSQGVLGEFYRRFENSSCQGALIIKAFRRSGSFRLLWDI